FLDVVWDKPVVGFIAEVSEVAPGAQQNVAQKQFVPGTDRYDFFPGGAIKPERQAWTESPEQENGASDKKRMQVAQGRHQSDQNRDYRRCAQIAIYRCDFPAGFSFCRGLPFQQALARDKAAD